MDTEFILPDMVCGGCAQSVTRALQALDPQARVAVDLPSQTVRVDSSHPRPELARVLADAGFSEARPDAR